MPKIGDLEMRLAALEGATLIMQDDLTAIKEWRKSIDKQTEAMTDLTDAIRDLTGACRILKRVGSAIKWLGTVVGTIYGGWYALENWIHK